MAALGDEEEDIPDPMTPPGTRARSGIAPRVALIGEVWQNEDATTPSVLERPEGKTGLSIMNPEDFASTWSKTAMPASADELTVVIWPHFTEEIPGIPNEPVIFPAKVHAKSSAATLLRGEACHLGAKRITLRHDSSKEFKTKQAFSLMVELEAELVDKQAWDRIIVKAIDFVQGTVGKNSTLLSSWGTRFWDDAEKLSTPSECCRVTTNISISPGALDGVLKLSGTNMSISPRQGQEVFRNYRPIWIRGRLADCRRKHDTVLRATGIIKGNRGFAVSIPSDHVDDAKKTLYPGQPLQPSLHPAEQVCMELLRRTCHHCVQRYLRTPYKSDDKLAPRRG